MNCTRQQKRRVMGGRRTGVFVEVEGRKNSVLNMAGNDFLSMAASSQIEVGYLLHGDWMRVRKQCFTAVCSAYGPACGKPPAWLACSFTHQGWTSSAGLLRWVTAEKLRQLVTHCPACVCRKHAMMPSTSMELDHVVLVVSMAQ